MPCGSIKASPSICRPPQIPSTGPPCCACSAIAASRPCTRNQAKSPLVCLEPGRMIQSLGFKPAKSTGLRTHCKRKPGIFFKGWNSSRLLIRGYAMTAIVVRTAPLAVLRSSNTPSSSGKPCCHHIGNVATVGTPVKSCNICGAGASSAASPRNLFSTKPRSSARSCGGNKAQVPYKCANAPPLSMSVTSKQAAFACKATRMFTMSLADKLISAGEPAPSMTTTSWLAINSSSAAAIRGHT